MRYYLSIDLNKKQHNPYSFHGTEIARHLKVECKYQPERYIQLTTLCYERENPGLIEKNWANPLYSDGQNFIFIAGYVLYRNAYNNNGLVPGPKVIKGNYYIIYLNKSEEKIYLYSSPMFMHPAFYSYKYNRLIFSNYIEAFNEYIPLSIDERGLVEFSLFDHSIYDRTIYNEIKNIPGGHLITFQNSKTGYHLAYDVAEWYSDSPTSRKDSLGSINNSLKTSIGNYINNTDKFNISLTGGFDGRLNLSFIDKADYPRLRAMSYGMTGSNQIRIPEIIANKLGFEYSPVLLDDNFENVYNEMGHADINLTCGITGFNRAVYSYAYDIIKDYSRSCILGQCDMIRPLYNNPAGVIFNDFTHAIFFNDFKKYKNSVLDFTGYAFIKKELISENIIKNIYDEIYDIYIKRYLYLNRKLQYYFFLIKESMMKYWHTEFHLVDIFVDDYVSFADLDYLELLFSSEYAGIYKGLLAENQFGRMKGQDLYIDLMTLNNNKLNYIMSDRYFFPGWLKYGVPGFMIAGISKKIGNIKNRKNKNDTFNSKKWSELFYIKNKELILNPTSFFNIDNISTLLNSNNNWSSEMLYRINRSVSIKLWLDRNGLI
jgi:hypothetical protein